MAGYSSEHDFQFVNELGAGNFGVCKLMRHRDGEYVACKYLPRNKVDENVEREVMIHSTLHHPNIVGFKSVFCTAQHLVIVMEYAAGGELFDRVKHAGHFTEDEARYFFQQLISGVEYCHLKGVAHRDLKLENTLLDGSAAPLLKIADFGYSKSSAMHTPPKSTVGTPAYIGPEVLMKTQYDGAAADVWSCGVHLYVMLVGAYPFDDTRDPKNLKKTIQNILAARYAFPSNLALSPQCMELLQRILVVDPRRRITIPQIKQHPWYLWNLPNELKDGCRGLKCYPKSMQPQTEVVNIIRAARGAAEQQAVAHQGAGAHSV